ncbi:MAG: 30S ribosome-binding factor RbfA [Patescibacteria group bacterium]
MENKREKLNSLLQKEISETINELVELPENVLATVSRVECATNLNSIKIFVSCFPIKEEKETIKLLQKNHQVIIENLNSKLKFRKMPKFFFKVDKSEEFASNIEKELVKIHKDES